MATHSSVLAWRIPGMGEPGGLPSMGLHRVGYDWSDLAAAASFHMVIRYLYIFFEAMSVWILCLFLNWFFCVCVSLFFSFKSIQIFWILYPYQIYDVQVFSPTVWEKNIHFLNNVLWNKKIFNFDEVQLIVIFCLAICAFEKPLPETRSQRFTPVFPSFFYNFSSYI